MGSGILVIDKPHGPTSHDVVARVRRSLGVRRIGHAGTLDPIATGVLVLAVGEATKLVPWLVAQDKAYDATIALGVETDTLDVQGRVVRCVPLSPELRAVLSKSGSTCLAPELRAALQAERIRNAQVPPAFSAVKRNGERAYALARRGSHTALDPRDVHVLGIELLACSSDPPSIRLALVASKGYYVRALARDLAAALRTVGHLTALRRTRSGCFVQEEAVGVEATPEELWSRIHPLPLVAKRLLPLAELTDMGVRDARHGRSVRPGDIAVSAHGPSAWLDPQGELVAIGQIDETGHGKVMRGFV
jgi:tRNA pseudouridine55 synthase